MVSGKKRFSLITHRSLFNAKKVSLILTLKIDAQSFEFFDDLRRKHFPRKRNFLAAHVTLFHHLPDEEITKIKQDLTEICAATGVFQLEFTKWRFLGKGTAMKIESAELVKLRTNVAEIWQDWLVPQDRQKIQPHITIQNKVAPDEARRLYENLAADWRPTLGTGAGLLLWHYRGGPWELEQEFDFLPTDEHKRFQIPGS